MTHRVQFDIEDDLYERALPYIKNKKTIGTFGMIAFEEWVKRREGRDSRTREENLLKDVKRLQKLIDSGRIKL